MSTVSKQLINLVVVTFALLALGCQTTTETTVRNPSGGAPGSAPIGASSQAPAARDPGAETDVERRARIRVDLAASYYQDNKPAIALEELRQALLAKQDYAPAYGLYGLIYMSLGENAKADDNFRRSIALKPADPDLNNNYGWFLCQTNRSREALNFFNTALADPLYTTPAKPLHNAGICSLRMGDERAAESYFLKSFQIDASNPVAMYNLSELYLRRNDVTRAKFYSQRLVGAYDPSAEVLWQAIRVERKVGDRASMESYATQLRRKFPNSREAGLLQQGLYD